MDSKIRISVLEKSMGRGKAKNIQIEWVEFKEKLKNPKKDSVTLKQYLALSSDEQSERKNVGSYVCGHFRDGLRKIRSLKGRSLLALDLDDATPEQIEYLFNESRLLKYEFVAHTTRKHQKEKPRWRIILRLKRELTPQEYIAVSRIFCSKLLETEQESMDAFDDVSFRPAQVAYWPSVCKKADFEYIDHDGKIVNPDKILNARKDWENLDSLPFSLKRGRKRFGHDKDPEDPLEKEGIIGDFCRTYSIEEAIEEFLQDIYEPSDDEPWRYTYLQGSGKNGAVVEDDGRFLYSFHSTDPCSEQLVNAFDMVRLHLFSEEDDSVDFDTPVNQRPSFKKMTQFASSLPMVQQASAERNLSSIEGVFEDEDIDEDIDEDENEDPQWREHLPLDRKEMLLAEAQNLVFELPPELRGETPFPLDDLGEVWKKKCQGWAEAFATSEEYTATLLLTVVAGLIGNARNVKMNGADWHEPCVLWSILVGSPSSNKSPAMDPFQKALTELQAGLVEDYYESIEQDRNEIAYKESLRKHKISELNTAIKNENEEEAKAISEEIAEIDSSLEIKPPVLYVKDITPEKLIRHSANNPRGLTFFTDEISGWIAGMDKYKSAKGSERAMWLEAFGARPYRMDRVHDENKPIYVPRFAVSIVGTTQPERLTKVLSDEGDGMQSRFLFSCPETKTRKLAWGVKQDNKDDTIHRLRQIVELECNRDDMGNVEPESIDITEGAFNVFSDWVDYIREETQSQAPLIQEFVGKAPGVVGRIALVLRLLSWTKGIDEPLPTKTPKKIGEKTIRKAINIWENYYLPQAIKVHSRKQETRRKRNARNIVKFVIAAGWEFFSFEDLRGSDALEASYAGVTDYNKATQYITDAMEYLMIIGWVSREAVVVNAKERAKARYVLNQNMVEWARENAPVGFIFDPRKLCAKVLPRKNDTVTIEDMKERIMDILGKKERKPGKAKELALRKTGFTAELFDEALEALLEDKKVIKSKKGKQITIKKKG